MAALSTGLDARRRALLQPAPAQNAAQPSKKSRSRIRDETAPSMPPAASGAPEQTIEVAGGIERVELV
ncbi:MAG TPA: hypothetical protein VNG52_00730, partial [Stellaceae bacterium]|nr:hypothetical protein [Stellaceae bacterium]